MRLMPLKAVKKRDPAGPQTGKNGPCTVAKILVPRIVGKNSVRTVAEGKQGTKNANVGTQ